MNVILSVLLISLALFSQALAKSALSDSWGVISKNGIDVVRKGGLCDNHCSNHGTCETNLNCNCFTGIDSEPEWTGPDCSLRTCPKDKSWVGEIVDGDPHPLVECSNKGTCDRTTGTCQCFPGYDGIACQRTVCNNNCNDRGTCWNLKMIAANYDGQYDAPWDSDKQLGCICDSGFRGPSCEFVECPTGEDPLDGYGASSGRDCSGRGLCDYSKGTCQCFSGFYGNRCQHQTTVI